MKKIVAFIIFLIACLTCFSQNTKVDIMYTKDGVKMQVDGEDFIINGMNWSYFPIGTNYDYSLWEQPEETIQAALDYEMGLLQNIGVNAIRVYTGIPPKWITYICKNYGIYTMLNHSFGRYGLELNGQWVANTNYANPETRALLLEEIKQTYDIYKGTHGLLLYLLGNENNYGLFWGGAETEDIPDEQEKIAHVGETRAKPMYSLMNEATLLLKKWGATQPIAICNGDLMYLDMIAEECQDVDIFGTNIYRGASFTDTYEVIKKKYNKPVLFTEFGSDAYDAINEKEDQESQAYYLIQNWKEIYQNAEGLGKSGIAIGGFTFQFSDGWWKYGQTFDLDVHNTEASWANGGYEFDFEEGKNNMNEEWFGVCAKGETMANGTYKLYPRKAYYALQQIHQINPYDDAVNNDNITSFFNAISIDKLKTSSK